MKNETKTALLVIDMLPAFLDPESAFYTQGAEKTVEPCKAAMEAARQKGIPVIVIHRRYRANGSDVEITRYAKWKEHGRPMNDDDYKESKGILPKALCPQWGDYLIIKPRWSAFFHTELDLLLRRLGVETVVLIGTTTPNCIRATAYDANSLDYNVIVLEDATSAQTEEIQRVNLQDMERMGAIIMNFQTFQNYNHSTVTHLLKQIQKEVEECEIPPEKLSHFFISQP